MNTNRECESASAFARRRAKIYGVIIVVACLVSLILVSFQGRRDPGAAISKQKASMLSIALAIEQFELLFKSFPNGDNAAVARQLLGSNARDLVLLNARTNKFGELIDCWDTPYNFEVKNNQLSIHSAGPNQKFYDTDDFIFDAQSRMFSKL